MDKSILNKYFELYNSLLFPELPRSTDLGGYTIEEFVQFYVRVLILFKYYIFSDKKKGHTTGYILEEKLFNKQLVDISLLEEKKVIRIIKDLTFDGKNKKRLIYFPFTKNYEKYHYSPILYSILHPAKMLIGALNKTHKKKVYDKLSTDIEKYWCNKIGTELKLGTNYEIFIEPMITDANGNYKTPDFIIIDRNEKQLLIIDYKHFVTPFSYSEIYNKEKEVEKGIRQILNYKKIIIEFGFENQAFDIKPKNYKVCALLLFNSPMPITSFHTEIFFSNYIQFKSKVSTTNSLGKLTDEIGIEFNKYLKTKVTYSSNEIIVRDWRYKYKELILKK